MGRARFLDYRCRHQGSKGVGSTTCKAGIEPRSVVSHLTPEQMAELSSTLRVAWPCTQGCRAGLHCDLYGPWTEEEIAADEAETRAVLDAVSHSRCTCGATLYRSGPYLQCSANCPNPVLVRDCARSGGRHG